MSATTIAVYDSLGAKHSVPVVFTKGENNKWVLSLGTGGDTYTITEADGEDTESMDWRRILTERWDVPIIFTTQVQFLNTLFAGGNSSIRRMNSLQDSIVIFDEIQTLPVRCTFLFNAAMNFLKDFCHTNNAATLCISMEY